MENLINQLPEGSKGRSIESPRTIVLMKWERKRRRYNWKKKENLDLLTFITDQLAKKLEKPVKEVNTITRLIMEIAQFDKLKHYQRQVNEYNENFANFKKY